MTQIQSNKQDIGQLQKKIKNNINEYRSSEPSSPRIVPRWSNNEILLAIKGKLVFCIISITSHLISELTFDILLIFVLCIVTLY